MNVVALRYGKHTHIYKRADTYSPVGLDGIEGEITCGTMKDDVWCPIESHFRIYKTNDTSDTIDLHIVLPDLPDDVVVALVQTIGDDIVAVTPLRHFRHVSEYQRFVTRYLQVERQA